eukprot:86066-Alexandrium_andersonii.AAC.1
MTVGICIEAWWSSLQLPITSRSFYNSRRLEAPSCHRRLLPRMPSDANLLLRAWARAKRRLVKF